MQHQPRSNFARCRDAALWLVLTLMLLVASVVLPALNAASRPVVFTGSTTPAEWFRPLPPSRWELTDPHKSSRDLPGYSFEMVMAMPARGPDSPNTSSSLTLQDRCRVGLPFTSVSRVACDRDPLEADLFTFTLAGNTIRITSFHLGINTFSAPHDIAATNSFYIPIVPFWPGLIANTIFWGLVAWFILFGMKRIRFARRRAKGLCTNCTFPVHQLPRCPECGQPHLASAR